MKSKLKFLFLFIIYLAYLFFLKLIVVFLKRKDHVMVFLQNSHIGGTRKYSYDLINYLADQKFNVTILSEFCGECNFENLANQKISVLEIPKRFEPVYHIYSLKHSLFKYFLLENLKYAVVLSKCQIKARASVIILSIAEPSQMFASFICNANIYYILHTTPWVNIDVGNKWILSRYEKKVKIITVSNYTKNEILKFWRLSNNCNNVSVIHNFSVDLMREYRGVDSEIKVVCIASVVKDKNPYYFIECAINLTRKFQNVIFYWIGDGPLLSDCILRCINFPRVIFDGHHDNIKDILNKAQIYFHPSLCESHGITVIEAMSCGLPCIVTNVGGTTESVLDGVNGFHISPTNITNGIETLTKLIESKDLREQMGNESRLRFNNFFTKATWTEKMDSIFDI